MIVFLRILNISLATIASLTLYLKLCNLKDVVLLSTLKCFIKCWKGRLTRFFLTSIITIARAVLMPFLFPRFEVYALDKELEKQLN